MNIAFSPPASPGPECRADSVAAISISRISGRVLGFSPAWRAMRFAGGKRQRSTSRFPGWLVDEVPMGTGLSARRPIAWAARVPLLLACALLPTALAGVLSPAAAAVDGAGTDRPAWRIVFDIPSQPLADALQAYSFSAGVEVLVDGELISGRRSTGVTGLFTPESALQGLLAGTGLVVRYTGPDIFTLVAIERKAVSPQIGIAPPDMPPPIDEASPARVDRRYSALLQTAVKRALCRYEATRPGYYRLLVRLWIGPSGAVARAALLGSTGRADRDAALASLFAGLWIGEPPPARLPQPVTLLILPRVPQDTADCTVIDSPDPPAQAILASPFVPERASP